MLLNGDKFKPSLNEPIMSKKDGSSTERGIKVFGFDLMKYSSQQQLLILALGNLSCSLLFAYLQEKVFLINGVDNVFISLLTTLSFALCGFVECYVTGDTKRKASLRQYAQLSVFTLGGIFFTNYSLKYLNYPTRVMFKSSKVIPVMVVSVLLQGKRYTNIEYLGTFILVLGIVIFTIGDSEVSPKFDIKGVALISLGVIFDALTSNYEEKSFFRGLKCSQAEVMMWASIFGSIWATLGMFVNGTLFPSIGFAMQNPNMVFSVFSFAVMGYCSSIFILVLIKHFGATEAEIVKSCRKVFTIILSFLTVAKPITFMHIVGGLIFTLSILLSVYAKKHKKSPIKTSDSNDREAEPFVKMMHA